ncbi:MAG: 5'-methylthioadenosine/S-adenosylhomocysteine nucleosidase [Lachnospiraceae bacterium]|nr:5'-methylthioadenosine/S-adenosylhomocysteine nucleosidase [Lachnospiraceae bacterium]
MRKIGILCACEKELNPYIADMQDIFTTEYAMHTFYHGKIKDINIVAVYSGCGKINAAITAQQLIDKYEVDTIIFSGIAGGMKEEIGIFDTVVCTSSEFRDTDNEIYTDFPIMDSPVFYADDHLLEVAKSAAIQADWKIHFGLATTGDIFTKNISPNALCIDMETAAAAHTCYMCNVPFIAIRSISDNKSDNGQEAINRNFDKAAYQSFCFVELMLSMLKRSYKGI